uniref:SCM-like with MBT domains protein n=1 Tax=Dugesia japonica TaxID=6161 RepID=A0A481NUZ9_DUGJA|nr:SCM-like with MBT domains protein [Dugesia japonica]
MSSIWYEYLEETGGEIIPAFFFKHVSKSFTKSNGNENQFNISPGDHRFAFNYESNFWWPISIIEKLSEGWIKIEYYGVNIEDKNCNLWFDLKNKNEKIQSIKWCLDNKKEFKSPNICNKVDIDLILEKNKSEDSKLEFLEMKTESYRLIKVGAYLECWLENSVGFVWPVKVLSNIGGRLKLIWFGCDSTTKQPNQINNNVFYMFYLDYHLHSLGWAKLNGWKYSPPLNIGINISISNVDTFVRGSPSAFPMEMSCSREIKEHFFEEGWQIEAVNPIDPSKICPAIIRYVLDKTYFLVELCRFESKELQIQNGISNDNDRVMFAGFGGMAELLPANTSRVSGYSVVGLKNNSWETHLSTNNPQRYAPHLGYFQNGGGIDFHQDTVFLPGCKLEAVNPWNKQTIHAATLIRSMEGSRLVWIRLDSEPDVPDFLIDPVTSTEIFPVGWCEMVGHHLVLPSSYLLSCLPLSPSPFDSDEITIYLHPACYLGPYLSRSAATELLPQFIGPGHCLPVFRELFHLLLKVSHKPYKLMRLLQLDRPDDRHESMATIVVPSPKSEWGNHNNNNNNNNYYYYNSKHRSNWLVEVAVRKRAIPGFCRQTALSLGSCPYFLTTSPIRSCSLSCDARLAAKAGEKMSHQRRKRLFSRPLMSLGISYRELKSRVAGAVANSNNNNNNNNSSNSEMDYSSDREDQNNNGEQSSRMCTRGMRLVVSDSVARRPTKRRTVHHLHLHQQQTVKFLKSPKSELIKTEKIEEGEIDGSIRREGRRGRDVIAQSVIDMKDYVIDPTFLAGDIERVTLSSNPLNWSVEQLAEYLSGTDCRQLTTWLANEKVDGRAFLLLTLPVLSTLCGLQLEVAIRLCRHVVSLKRVFVEQYADLQELLPSEDV